MGLDRSQRHGPGDSTSCVNSPRSAQAIQMLPIAEPRVDRPPSVGMSQGAELAKSLVPASIV